MTKVTITKTDLNRAISACDVSGDFYLLQDGSIHWQDKNGAFPLPDDALVAIPVFDPDGSGSLTDSCWDSIKELYKDKPNYEDIKEEAEEEGVIAFLSERHPDHYETCVEFLKEAAIEQLKLDLEQYYIYDEDGREVSCPYVLEIEE